MSTLFGVTKVNPNVDHLLCNILVLPRILYMKAYIVIRKIMCLSLHHEIQSCHIKYVVLYQIKRTLIMLILVYSFNLQEMIEIESNDLV